MFKFFNLISGKFTWTLLADISVLLILATIECLTILSIKSSFTTSVMVALFKGKLNFIVKLTSTNLVLHTSSGMHRVLDRDSINVHLFVTELLEIVLLSSECLLV